MFKSLLAKLAAMSLLSKTIAVAAAAVIVVGAVAIGVTTQNPSVDPDDQQSGPQQEQLGDVTPDDENEDGSGSGDSADSDDVVVEDDRKDSDKKDDDKKKDETEGILGNIFVKKYTVKFETNGGGELEKVCVLPGTAISSFDTPYFAEHIFLGWYYDEDLTQAVESEDKVTEDVTLYASYLEQTPLETLETVNFASAEDVDAKTFSISVVASDEEMTAADVLAAIDVDDLSDPDATDLITVGAVAGAENTFKVSGKGGFNEGGSYRISLNDDKLTFKDQPESAREFNFTVHRDEVMNLTMQADIQYIPVSQVSNIVNNGAAVATLDLALYQTDGNSVSPSELSKGTFTYRGNLTVGEIVCVYDGAHPTERNADTPKADLGDMAYVEITGKNGTTYTYESAEAEDVLFTPDVLPMPESADTDTNAATVTVENKYLDYSADMYSYMNLDSQTVVEAGDFLAFYTGEIGVESGDNAGKLTGYGKITEVKENNNDTTTITYITVTWEEVESCMAVYTEDTLSGAEMLEGVDTEDMEAEIEQQAYDSGFAEEAAMYLTSLALATENFTALSDNVNLDDYKVTLTDGTPVSPETLQLMSGGDVSAEIQSIAVSAKVSKNPSHLGNINGTNADDKGLSISLGVKVVFTVGSDDSDGYLEITVTGNFIEEIGVDMGANADAVWDKAWIFPYISDIKASAHVDAVNYTAVSFNATMITKEKDDSGNGVTDALNMATELKSLLSKMPSNEEEAKSTQNKMVQRYAEIINEDSDWITVVEKNITEVRKNIPFGIPLIKIGFSVDFVVEMDAAISVGFDFEYIEGKRHVFTIELKDQNVYADTIELKEKSYQFCFYAMGRIGVKAGITMEFSISAISADLASVGIEAGAGAYLNLRGYFFYELRYTASQGKTQQYNGALMIDTGVYMKAGLDASALGGKYSASVNFFNKKWPLYSAGVRENVLDFSTKQDDMPAITMKQYVRKAIVPDSVFLMRELDLETGRVRDAYYTDMTDGNYPASKIDGYDFVITITNDKFTYNPRTNTIAVNPDEDDVKLEGEMVITYKQNGVAFSSKAIQRTISLYWDNLRDGYFIAPESNGGSYIPMIIGAYESKVKAPANPDRFGYIFDGWYSNEELTVPYTFPQTMPATDTNIYAKWAPRTDIPYTVEHYLEDLYTETYQLVETETFKGTTDSYVTPETKTYTGYISPAQASIKVEADGSATLSYYYRLETHNVTFYPGEVGGDPVAFTLKYGAGVPVPQMAASGYAFVGWTVDGTNVVTPEEKVAQADLSYTAKWEKEPDTAYRMEYYVQQADGRFTLQYMYEGETFTGTTFSANELRTKLVDGTLSADQKYIDDGVISFRDVTVKGIPYDNPEVDGSGKTVIKVNYARAEYTLTFDLGYEDKTIEIKDFVGAEVFLPENPTRTGYTFLGWSKDGTNVVTPATIIGEENITYKALWKANEYTVKFDANSGTGTMADMAFTYDVAQNLTANAFTRAHYDFAGWANSGVSYADGESVTNLAAQNGAVITLTAKWTPKNYTVTYHNVEAGEHTNRTTFTVESDDITLSEPSARVGYTFGGWYANEGCTGNAVTKIVAADGNNRNLYAKWAPNTDTAYTVEHYQQQLDGSYTLVDTDNLTGTTAAEVTPATKSYIGFKVPAAQTVTIAADGSLVVEYQYARQSYTVSLNANGGAFTDDTTEMALSFLYGETISLPVLKDRDGYAFSCWQDNGGAIFSGGTMGAEDLTLTAKWEAGKIGYTVYHYLQNVDGTDSTVPAKTVSGTADMDTTVTPALENYVGFTAPNSTTTLTITATAANNVVEYRYTRNQYALTWDLKGGSASGQTYTSGQVYFDAPITAPVPVKEGYRLSWDKTVAAKMPAESVTYTANWAANSYTVKFNVNGGNGTMADMNFVYGTAQNLPANAFTRTGYTFAGWATAADGAVVYTDGASVSNLTAEHNGSVTLYAVWTANNYAVKFHANGGSGTMTNLSLTYDAAAKALTANSFTRTGYTFTGWATASNGTVVYADQAEVRNLTAVSGDVVALYAVWAMDTYTITYGNVSEGAHTNPKTYTVESDTITLSEPNKRDGYDFMGWYDNEACTGDAVTKIAKGSTGNKTLYAKWTLVEYKIEYKLNGGSNHSDNPKSFTINDNTFTLNEPTRAGYQFLGWFSDKDMTVQVINPVTLEDYRPWTFYAKWTPLVYTVMLYKNDGTEDVTPGFASCENDWTAVAPTRAGYTFEGWAYSKDGEVVCGNNATLSDFILDSHTTNDDIELFAQWELNTCTITYDLGTGADENPMTNPASFNLHNVTLRDGTVNSASVQLADPVGIKAGYEFLGWYNGDEKVENIKPAAPENETLTLKAKWAHSGIFSIEVHKDTVDNGPSEIAGFDAKFTVTRSRPTGAERFTDDVQTVYVRTLNGTAYGTTPEMADATGQDQYHFVHTNPTGYGSGYLTFTFTDDDTQTQTITVTEKDQANWDFMPSSFWSAQKNAEGESVATKRHYFVEIYKVTGGGVVDAEDGTAKRDLPLTPYEVNDQMFAQYTKKAYFADGSDTKKSYTVKSSTAKIYLTDIADVSPAVRDYAFDAGISIQLSINGTVTGNTPAKVVIEARDLVNTSLVHTSDKVTWENRYNNTLGMNVTRMSISETEATGCKGFDMSYYAVASGIGAEVTLGNWGLQLSDTATTYRKPVQKHIAPLALTSYEKGEEVMLTVVFNEVLHNIDCESVKPTLLLSNSIATYFKDVEYVDNGAGTNTLVFKATVKQPLDATTVSNINAFLVNVDSHGNGSWGTLTQGNVKYAVEDFSGNKSTINVIL